MWLKRLVILTIIFHFISCSKDLVGPQYPDSPIKNPGASGIWILNEGGFGWGNASISFYDSQRKQMSNRVFSQKQGTPVGDVLQSMFNWENRRYLVVNYSNYIKICDEEMNLLETISGLNSPRFMTNLNENELLITSFESQKIMKYNSITKEVLPFADVTEWSENILNLSDNIIVEQKSKVNVNPENQNILKFNDQGVLLNTIEIKTDHSELTAINDTKFCFISQTDLASTLWISDTSFQTEKYYIPEKVSQISYSNEHIYLAGENLWDFNIQTKSFTKIIPLKGRNIYGLNSSNDGFIYLTDAKDYVSQGDFMIFSIESKNFIDSVQASIIPSEIYFEP